MHNQNQPNEKRRAIVKKMAVLSATIISSPFVITPSRGATKKMEKNGSNQKIVIRTAGGNIQQYYTEHLFKPFYKESGIEVIGVSSKVEPTTEIKTMVENKNYMWNMSCLSHRAVHFLGKDYLEPHKLEKDPIISTIMPPFVTPYGVGMDVYALVLAYRTDAFEKKGLKAPKTWKDFWDVENFPGRRALRKVPFDTIEEALLADGALPSEVYPCDLNRAFRSLDRIKQHVPVWWQNAPDAGNLLTTGEVDLMSAFVVNVLFALDAKAPVAFSWDQHIRGCDNWAILKGTPNADACREFIKFATHPERQAQLAKYGVAPSQSKAFDYIDPEYFKFLSTYPDNFKKGLFSDALYWTKNQHFVTERFSQWMLS